MAIDWNYLFTNTDGRIGRLTYWIGIAAVLVLHALSYMLFGGGLIGILARLVITLIGFAVMIKRSHDIGRTGWLAAISLIPFIGTLFIIGLGLMPGDQGTNRYGPNPDRAVGGGDTRPLDRTATDVTATPVAGETTRRDV